MAVRAYSRGLGGHARRGSLPRNHVEHLGFEFVETCQHGRCCGGVTRVRVHLDRMLDKRADGLEVAVHFLLGHGVGPLDGVHD